MGIGVEQNAAGVDEALVGKKLIDVAFRCAATRRSAPAIGILDRHRPQGIGRPVFGGMPDENV